MTLIRAIWPVLLLLILCSIGNAWALTCPEGQTVAGQIRNWGGYAPSSHSDNCYHGRLIYPNNNVIHGTCFKPSYGTPGSQSSNGVGYFYALEPMPAVDIDQIQVKNCDNGCTVSATYTLTTVDEDGSTNVYPSFTGDYVNVDAVCVGTADLPPAVIPQPPEEPGDPSDPNCIGPACDNYEGKTGAFQGPGQAGTSYADTFTDFYERIDAAPVVEAVRTIGMNAGGAANCPPISFSVFGHYVASDFHCTVTYDMPLVPLMFIGIYSLIGVLIVMSS